MTQTPKWYTKPYIEEVIFFCSLFVLIMLPELMKSINPTDLLKTFFFFAILYGQALLYRYFIFYLFIAKRYLLYGIATVVFILLGTAVLLVADYFWLDPSYYKTEEDTLLDHYISHLVLSVISTSAILSIFLIRKYSTEVQKRNEAQLMLSEINIKYLHAQLNPHFFFNMFNNLYGVSLTDPTRTPELILKLSNLMRYQLENVNKDTVTLQEELAFISNYIAVEKERVGQRCAIEYHIEDAEQWATQYSIAPLLLITLVENAFKHSLTINRPWFIQIHVQIEKGKLQMQVQNSLPDEILKTNSTGIGLTNSKQRLELLYPRRYSLTNQKQEETYCTTLVLQLK